MKNVIIDGVEYAPVKQATVGNLKGNITAVKVRSSFGGSWRNQFENVDITFSACVAHGFSEQIPIPKEAQISWGNAQ